MPDRIILMQTMNYTVIHALITFWLVMVLNITLTAVMFMTVE